MIRLKRFGTTTPPGGVAPAAWFAHTICVSCLLLQRFGVTLGSGSQLNVAIIIAPVAFVVLLLNGFARLSASATFFFIIAALCALITTFLTILYPDFAFRFSLLSLEELGFLYAFFLLEPTERFDMRVVPRVFIFWARVIAIAAILQYALQFGGLRLFSFTALHVPQSILVESAYHVVAPINYGSSILRANGFFLLEPSILSQVMALACLLDGLMLKRYKFLALYAGAILASFSGTGPLVLILSTVLAGMLSPRQIPRVVGLLLCALLAAVGAAILFPNQFATLQARATGTDASAQARYLEQLKVLDTIQHDPRLVLGFGPGATDAYVHLGSVSAVLKLLFDYGMTGLVAFFAFLIVAVWRSRNVVICLSALLMFQLGGGYLLFPPTVFLIAMLCIWGDAGTVALPGRRRAPWAHTEPAAISS